MPEDVAAGDLVAAAREAAGPELREMRVFDVYRGDQVGEGRKSVAFSVSFQSRERTLSEEDAAALREKIVDALAERFGAEARLERSRSPAARPARPSPCAGSPASFSRIRRKLRSVMTRARTGDVAVTVAVRGA